MRPVRLAVVGTSGIGRQHTGQIADCPETALIGLSGLDEGAEAVAREHGVPLSGDYRDLVELEPDGVIVATPNRFHLEMGAFFAEHGIHVLVEKPITDTVTAGKELCDIADRNGAHLLVGHQRRHNARVQKAAELVSSDIGDLVASNTLALMRKPDSYYEMEWRRTASAGPLLINLIHDIDLLRAVCGEIDAVHAVATKHARSFEFFDTAAVILHYRNGAVGTVVISDSAPSPWNWEATVSEGLGLPTAGQDHAVFSGTDASFSFPSMTMWSYDPTEGEVGWERPIHHRSIAVEPNSPYRDQIANFAAVIRGNAAPVVSGRDGLRSLAVVEAVMESARTGRAVNVDTLIENA